MKKFVIIAVLVVCVLVIIAGGAIAFLVMRASQPPYTIDQSKISTSYLKSKTTVGSYKLIVEDTLPNPYEESDFVESYFSKDGKMPEFVASPTFVRVSNGDLQTLLNQIKNTDCTPKSQVTGESGSTQYISGKCGHSDYYIYKNGSSWIFFNTEDGTQVLDEVIKGY